LPGSSQAMSSLTLKGEADPAGRFARTRRKDNRSEQKLVTSQLIAASRTPIVVTTEVSPIIEVTINPHDPTKNSAKDLWLGLT
jgi:hypothetical protein